jgi:uroporphyrinogen decarboxylase
LGTNGESAQAGESAPPQGAGNRRRFLDACHCRAVDRPPVWLMRQAGRALPEYRELKKTYSFLQLVQIPELAMEVTLQPIRRFGFDAAILFSDILVIAEALGQAYRFRETGGIEMAFAIKSAADIDRLDPAGVRNRLHYVADALRLVKRELDGQTALIGFAGAPWTLANFMLEGGSSPAFTRARALLEREPVLYHRLCEKLSAAIGDYLLMQIEAGAEAIQLFDTLAGHLGEARFGEASARWLREIIARVEGRVPVIVFAKGINQSWPALVETGATVLGVDASVRLAELRRRLPPHIAVQGNLDPAWLRSTPDQVRAATREILEGMRGCRGHIFNLGHGVPPEATLENLAALADTVQRFA